MVVEKPDANRLYSGICEHAFVLPQRTPKMEASTEWIRRWVSGFGN